jgi:flagellar hook assembly protein FlgD
MIYDLHGQQVKQLADEVQTSGYHRLAWDATDDSGSESPAVSILSSLSPMTFV